MVTELNLLAYGIVVVLGAMSPGPDFVVVTRHASTGRRTGLAAATGTAAGMAVNTAAALVGLGAVLLASPNLYTAFRVVAIAYLAYLGIRALWAVRPVAWRRSRTVARDQADAAGQAPASAPAGPDPAPAQAGDPAAVATRTVTPTSSWSAFRQGLFTNFLNPKVVIFLLTLTPQFMPEHPSLRDRLGIFVVSVVAVLLWFSALALTVSLFSRWLRRPKVNTAITFVTGVALLAIAVNIGVAML